MSFSPIAFIAPNYRDFKNDYLKAYEPGTTTPKVIALDSAGAVQVAKLQLNADGFIMSAGNAIVIPYINGSYDLWLFPTEAEADANDTSNAERLADNLSAAQGLGEFTFTTNNLINGTSLFNSDVVVLTSGFTTSGDGGSGSWKQNGVTGQAASQSPAQLVDGLLNDGNGNQWALVVDIDVKATALGLSVSNSGEDNLPCLRASNSLAGSIDATIVLPFGDISLTTTDSIMIDVGAKIKGQGQGKTTLNITLNNASFPVAFNLNVFDLSLKDMSINFIEGSTIPNGPILFQIGAANDLTLERLTVDLGATVSAGELNWGSILFSLADDCSFVKIKDNKFTNFKWGLLKTNAATSSQFVWDITGNTFQTFYAPALTFNTPSGRVAGITITNNNLIDNKSHEVTIGNVFPHMGGVAGGNNSDKIVFANNHFSGAGQGLHFEEHTKGVIIDGNTFNLGETAIQILDNDIGGVAFTPTEFIISNNIINQAGTTHITAQTLTGIECIFDGSALNSVEDIVISGNIINGFEVGIKADRGLADYSISGNTIKFCDFGMRLASTTAGIEGNIIKNCPVGIARLTKGQGTSLGQNTFFDCNVPISDEASNTLGVLTKGLVVDKIIDIPDGVTSSHYIMPLGNHTASRITVIITASDTANRGAVYDITWDGTTFVDTLVYGFGGGNIFNLTVLEVTNTLHVSIQSAIGADTEGRVEVSTQDLWIM
jgi:hypothetical protein